MYLTKRPNGSMGHLNKYSTHRTTATSHLTSGEANQFIHTFFSPRSGAAIKYRKGGQDEVWIEANDSWRHGSSGRVPAGCSVSQRTSRATTETTDVGRRFQKRPGSQRDSRGRIY